MKRGTVNLRALPDLTQGLEVRFDETLGPSQRRLMDALGVEVVEPEVERDPLPSETTRCKACDARAASKGISWPA